MHRAGRGDVAAAATVAGLQTEPLDIFHDGTQRGVQLELTLAGARALLGVPAAVLAYGVFALDDVVGYRAGELAERVTIPALVITGEQSPSFLRNAARAVARTLSGGRLAVLPGQTHDINPDATAPVMAKFLIS
jgi:pimeloyl-ACP methyl ester carboxylesterase